MTIRDNILIILLVGLLCAVCLNFVFHSLYWAFFPYEIDQEEGFCAERVSWIIKGMPLYPHLDSYPFIRNTYPPLFFFYCLPFFLFLGKRLIIGRIVSLVFTLLTAFYIYKIVAKRTAPLSAAAQVGEDERRGISLGALAAAGLFFSSKYIFLWAPLFRVDMAANFFSILALYVISANEDDRHIILAAALSSIAVFTKQSYLAVVTAIFLYLVSRDFLKSMKFLLASGSIIGVSFMALQIATNGNFASHVLYPAFGFLHIDRLKWFVFEYVRICYIPLLFSFYFLFFVKGETVYKLYFLCQVPLLLTLLASGSTLNHLIGIFTAMCILTGLSVRRFCERPGHPTRGLVAILLLYFLVVPNDSFRYFDFRREEINPWTNRPAFDKIVDYIRQSPGDVLSEYASFAYLAEKDVLLHPLNMSPCYKISKMDLSQLLADCRNRRFSCIVYKAFMPSVLGGELYANYYPVDVLKEKYSDWLGQSNTWFIMKPRRQDGPGAAENGVVNADFSPNSHL